MYEKWIDLPLVRRPGETSAGLARRMREVESLKLKCLERTASEEELKRLFSLTKPAPRW